jgi:hypothetical protein
MLTEARRIGYLRSLRNAAKEAWSLRAQLRRGGFRSKAGRRAFTRLTDMDFMGYRTIRWDDPLFWGVLAATPRWESTEERCLSRMFEHAKPAQQAQVIARAETLCENTDPSRARVLGELCLRRGADEPAARLLKDAVARLPVGKQRGSAEFALFRAYLNLGQGAEAEEELPAAMRQFLSRDSHGAQLEKAPEWMAQTALLLARAGDEARAMGLWRRVANIDAAYLGPLPQLAQAGLREDLRRFYAEWQRADPASWVPAEALKQLSAAK